MGGGVDGTRDQPPGKNAENWSRRDGIRAGAVSGPWRSAPRAQTGTAPPVAADVAPTTPPVPVPPRRPLPSRRKTQAMIAAVVGGLIGALGLILAAYLFRPEPDPGSIATAPPSAPAAPESVPSPSDPPSTDQPASPPASTPSPAPSTATSPPASATPADPALATVTAVRLRVGPGFPADRQQAIVVALEGAGLPTVQVEVLPFAITTSRIGYYRPEDLAAAEALGRIVGPVATSDGTAIGVRDYGRLLSDVAPGRLDLWIGS